MDYNKKVKYAERVAIEFQNKRTSNSIKSDLKKEGLFDREISNIMTSANNILEEFYGPKFKEYLLEEKEIRNAEEFESLDNELVERIIIRESKNIALDERKKITKLIKEGHDYVEVFKQVDQRFLSQEQSSALIANLLNGTNQSSDLGNRIDDNANGGGMLNVFGGIGLILLTVVIWSVSGRLFYMLPVIGIVMIGKGVT